MKHNPKITAVLLIMFVLTQFIGLYVVNYYSSEDKTLPYGLETPQPEQQSEFYIIFSQILLAFIIAVLLLFFLTKFKVEFLLKIWFFVVVMIALGISFNTFLPKFKYVSILALVLALIFAIFKIYKRNILVHNFTELLIYPGIAAVFVPILNIWTIIALLILISGYDMWAVWRSKFMQRMAEYQINNLKFFTGFFIPYADKKGKAKIKKIRDKYAGKSDAELEKGFKRAKVKVSLAILGGGDVIFPIIAAGVFYKVFGSIVPALIIAGFATLALLGLFVLARKGKFYPAMPFITAGIYLGMLVSWLLV